MTTDDFDYDLPKELIAQTPLSKRDESKLLVLDKEITDKALGRLKVDEAGLDETDHQFLRAIIEKFNGGPVGIETIASSIGEEISTIEDVYEPFLLQEGYIKRTLRGRVVTKKAYDHLGITYQETNYQERLF